MLAPAVLQSHGITVHKGEVDDIISVFQNILDKKSDIHNGASEYLEQNGKLMHISLAHKNMAQIINRSDHSFHGEQVHNDIRVPSLQQVNKVTYDSPR